jgi:hypothetical protein
MGISARRRRLEQLAVAVQGGSGGEEAARRRAAALATAGPGARAGSASQPYNNYSAEARGIGEQALVTARRSDLLPGVAPGPDGLTDEHVRCFCARGFLVIKPDKTPEFHRANVDEFDHNEGSYGGNMGGFGIHMDGLKAVYEDRHVQSALRSLLGPGCVMYQHNAMHRNGPGATNQSWHKDPYGPEAAPRHKHAFRICSTLPPTHNFLVLRSGVIAPMRYHAVDRPCTRSRLTLWSHPFSKRSGALLPTANHAGHRCSFPAPTCAARVEHANAVP